MLADLYFLYPDLIPIPFSKFLYMVTESLDKKCIILLVKLAKKINNYPIDTFFFNRI